MPVEIPIRRLMKHCNPYGENPWGGPKFSRVQVRKALVQRRLVSAYGTDDHEGRVAYFVENVSKDPIEIDVGVPSLGCYPVWFVTDGNHRLAAAIYAGRATILASVSGQLDYAKRLFGVDCQELQP